MNFLSVNSSTSNLDQYFTDLLQVYPFDLFLHTYISSIEFGFDDAIQPMIELPKLQFAVSLNLNPICHHSYFSECDCNAPCNHQLYVPSSIEYGYFNVFVEITNGCVLNTDGKQIIDVGFLIGMWLIFCGYNKNPKKYTELFDDSFSCYFTVNLKVNDFVLNIEPDYYCIDNELPTSVVEDYGYSIHIVDVNGSFKICSLIYDLQFLLHSLDLSTNQSSTGDSKLLVHVDPPSDSNYFNFQYVNRPRDVLKYFICYYLCL